MGKGACSQCMVHFLVVLGFSLLWLGASVLHIVIAFGFKQLFEVRFTIKFALKCRIVSKSTGAKKITDYYILTRTI